MKQMQRNIQSTPTLPDSATQELLGRTPIPIDMQSIREKMQGKVVLVTGAAGSIGSEICSQIAACAPGALIGFDQAETPIFHLQRGLEKEFPELAFHAEIGSLTRFEDVDRVFNRYHPSIVFHAAGLKHAPLMERHVFATVENNLFGTCIAAEAAAANGAECFIKVSTDKAVLPTSVMGATKRAAELALVAMQKSTGTKFASVRLGNVLGSSGSASTVFAEQIAAGGPLTVTYPAMERYFMTLRESSQVVLYAASVCQGGEIFVPELGTPVKVLDLAEKLIRLLGREPHCEIRIEFTGARPGEKLSEHLSLPQQALTSTKQPEIRTISSAGDLDLYRLRNFRKTLQRAIGLHDRKRVVEFLTQMVPEYIPAPEHLENTAATGASRKTQ